MIHDVRLNYCEVQIYILISCSKFFIDIEFALKLFLM